VGTEIFLKIRKKDSTALSANRPTGKSLDSGASKFHWCPERGAASLTLLRRAGTWIDTREVGPGSAAHRHSASKTRVNALMALRSIRGRSRTIRRHGEERLVRHSSTSDGGSDEAINLLVKPWIASLHFGGKSAIRFQLDEAMRRLWRSASLPQLLCPRRIIQATPSPLHVRLRASSE